MPPATKEPRRVAALRSEDRSLPRFILPGKGILASAALAACFASGLVLHSSEARQIPVEEAPATGLLEDTFRSNDLWLVTKPPLSEFQLNFASLPATAEPEAKAAETAEQVEPPWTELVVRRGDNLALIFQRAGFDKRDVHHVVSEAADGEELARIFPGQVVSFRTDDSGALAAVRLIKSPLETIFYRKGETGFSSEVVSRTPEARESWASAKITSSLFLAGREAGLSHTTIMGLANIFGGVIDFVQDPRQGDTIHVVYEELYVGDEKYADGEILAASFTNQGKTFNAFRYVDASGEANYYTEKGVSLRKAFLLAPLDFTRISSNFNMRRMHPIYKTVRPHRGTDYAAPTGTPVYAAGDGRVIKSGYKGSNGNYVYIKHSDQLVTHYLHLNKRTVKEGERVTQSQVIGTVGSTGAATGPHLHYEFLVDGVHRDPRTIAKTLPRASTLRPEELAAFRRSIRESSLQLASLRSDNQLAMTNSDNPDSSTN
ncbi:MAG: peptidoglycan DD-metalloendopeptidase family protein [Halioglobus sp.]|nr:peptidoglycan DD-metalloendopeptidase family protein [Halioglobus sp.]